jgi:hypothetical protein
MCPSLLASCLGWAASACVVSPPTVAAPPAAIQWGSLDFYEARGADDSLVGSGDRSFQWLGALGQSTLLLGTQHALRMVQRKTRDHLGGPFWADYSDSLSGLQGWSDGNPVMTNYVAHPMMGAIAGFIQIQNDPIGRGLVWNPDNPEYWKSRFKALGWATLYSTSFELAPWGEAGIGNVGKDHGTMGYVDLVITPLTGFGLILLEDYLDRKVIERIERGKSPGTARVLRVLLNPDRGIANLMRFKRPSFRDTREILGRRQEFALRSAPAPSSAK